MHHLLLTACCLAFLASPPKQLRSGKPASFLCTGIRRPVVLPEIAVLAQKYGAGRKLPDSVVTGGQPCPGKGEAAVCLLAVIDKVLDKCGKEGKDAVPQEDIDRISALHEDLKEELAQHEGYLTRREAIEKMLAKPDAAADFAVSRSA